MKLLAILASLVLGTLVNAQIATQGDARTRADPTEFHSPMVLSTVFAAADPSLWVSDAWTPEDHKSWRKGAFTTPEYHDLGKFTCDGLSLRGDYNNRKNTWESGLSMEVHKLAGQRVEVRIRATVTNPGHGHNVHDKVATLVLDVLNGEESVASTTMAIKVSASWVGKVEDNDREARLVLAADNLKTNPVTRLRITMSTRDY